MAPDYDHLSLMQKVEVFEHALEHTQGDDLAKILWLRSPSSEVWFDRRTNYTRHKLFFNLISLYSAKTKSYELNSSSIDP